ncbi:MAG: PAS domain S-box protein [Capsulimonas sp.]|uniref:PAS domain S-box protein n=1 Tax=Capsulimonas sp. TaxID=2494211 RepID=UPI0032635CBB
MRQNSQTTDSILESSAEAYVSLDREWRILRVNPEAERFLNKRSEELLGKILWEVYPDLVGTNAYYEYHRAMAERSAITLEEHTQRRDIWLELRGYPTEDGLAVYFRDISDRKRVEQALEESEERFRATFEEAALGIGHVAPDGRWLRVNQRLCDILGYTRDEMFLRTNQSMSHPDDLHDELDMLSQLLAGELSTYAIAKRYIHKNGGAVWVDVTMSVVTPRSGASRYLLAFVEDITGRRAAEEQLRQQFVLTRSLTDNTTEALFMMDTAGRVTFLNPAAEQLVGWVASDLVGKVLHDAVHYLKPDGTRNAMLESPLTAVFTTGTGVRNHEDTFVRRDGSFVPVLCANAPIIDPSGMIMGAVLAVHDNTDRKRAEQAVRESEERYRHIVDTTFEGVWSYDEYGVTTYVNGRIAEMLGYGPDEMLGRSIYDFVFDSDLAEARSHFTERLDGSKGAVESRLRRKDGSELYYLSSASALSDSGGRRTITAMISDITALKRAQAELEHAYQREHRISETLQRSLLIMPPRDGFPGLTIESLYEAAWDEAQVGGDFCDAFSISGGKIALVLGDVAGKGLAAAARTAEIKFTLRAFMRDTSSPAIAAGRLNEFVCEAHTLPEQTDDMIVSLTLAVFDPKTGDLEITVCGAEPPLILRTSGLCEEAPASGLPIGSISGVEYDSIHVHLNIGDTTLMATDGITEARRGNVFFGYEGMTRIAAQARSFPALSQIARAILSGAQNFAGGRLQDDACLLLARRTG